MQQLQADFGALPTNFSSAVEEEKLAKELKVRSLRSIIPRVVGQVYTVINYMKQVGMQGTPPNWKPFFQALKAHSLIFKTDLLVTIFEVYVEVDCVRNACFRSIVPGV